MKLVLQISTCNTISGSHINNCFRLRSCCRVSLFLCVLYLDLFRWLLCQISFDNEVCHNMSSILYILVWEVSGDLVRFLLPIISFRITKFIKHHSQYIDQSVALPVQRPREVLRTDRDAELDPDSRVKQGEEGRAFQREGPLIVKDLVWAIAVSTHRTKRACQSEEWSGRCEVADKLEWMWSIRYFGATPSLDLRTTTRILNSERGESGSQCNWLINHEAGDVREFRKSYMTGKLRLKFQF